MDIQFLGERIKEIRIKNNLSIKELAEKAEVSSSLISQIERGLANPSLKTLRSISEQLDISMFSFFENKETSKTMLVKASDRIKIVHGEAISEDVQLEYDLLTPDLKGAIQMCEMSLGPYQHSSDKLSSHSAEEVAVCTEGVIELHLENKTLTLKKGDSVRIEKQTFHFWRNPTSGNCSIIFAMSPPVF